MPIGLKIPNGALNIFVGVNNAGKSRILEYLNRKFKDQIDYVSPDRLRVKPKSTLPFSQNVSDYITQMVSGRKNHPDTGEIPGPDPIDEIVALKTKDRGTLKNWHNKYFEEMAWSRTDKENDWEVPTISIGGRTPGEQGSGSRAVFSLLVKLFDPKRPILAVDEPEISVEPPTQKKLLQLFKMVSQGADGLPKKQIFLATHSHLFLDRENIINNYIVNRIGDETKIMQVETEDVLKDVVLRLLGNSPSDLFFPSNIVIVEGPSDKIFLRKVLSLMEDSFKSRNVVFHPAKGESEVPKATIAINQLITTANYLPVYKDSICVLFDLQNGTKFLKEVRIALNDQEGKRVRQLTKDHIELYYPKEIMKRVCGFSGDNQALDSEIEKFASGQRDLIGNYKTTKTQLARNVADNLSSIGIIEQEVKDFLQVVLDKAFPK